MSQPKPSMKQRLVTAEQEIVLLKKRVFTLERYMQEIIDADVVTRIEVNAAFEELGRRLEHHVELGLSAARTIEVGTGGHLE